MVGCARESEEGGMGGGVLEISTGGVGKTVVQQNAISLKAGSVCFDAFAAAAVSTENEHTRKRNSARESEK
jgi:hypothetical protein